MRPGAFFVPAVPRPQRHDDDVGDVIPRSFPESSSAARTVQAGMGFSWRPMSMWPPPPATDMRCSVSSRF